MADTLQKEHAYSGDRIETAPLESPAEVSPQSEAASAGASSSPNRALADQVATLVQRARAGQFPSLADFAQFLKRTRRIWLGIAGAILALVVGVSSVDRLSAWIKNRREIRQEKALATLTPDHLIARCGQPAGDVTENVYPVLMRTITYEPDGSPKLVLTFSRTAEEKSDWVFLSMRDGTGATFDTNQGKIAAFSCLDSTK